MEKNRDEFSQKTKDLLAKKVGYRCSNPICRIHTVGANSNGIKAINIGVAAHITAAAKGGPRFNHQLSSEERKADNNGVWLCANCATLIDTNADMYTVELLKAWKMVAEYQSKMEIGMSSTNTKLDIDVSFSENNERGGLYTEIIELREENKKLKEEMSTNEQLSYHDTGYYTSIVGDKKINYYCSTCWDTEKILVHVPKPKALLELGERYYRCRKCNSYIKDGR